MQELLAEEVLLPAAEVPAVQVLVAGEEEPLLAPAEELLAGSRG